MLSETARSKTRLDDDEWFVVYSAVSITLELALNQRTKNYLADIGCVEMALALLHLRRDS